MGKKYLQFYTENFCLSKPIWFKTSPGITFECEMQRFVLLKSKSPNDLLQKRNP